jgi:S-methylmethionine-dependent homocysteine/selenocysteine methylase
MFDIELNLWLSFSLSTADHSHPIQILTKILIIFLILVVAALAVTLIAALAMVCINCSRPSRIHQLFR